MEQQSLEQASLICSCGRSFTHCRACGSRNVYVKRFRTLELGVTVYGCRRCSQETNDSITCSAPIRTVTGAGFKPFVKEPQATPYGSAVPGSEEHYRLLAEWIVEHQNKKGWDRVRVYVEAQIAGWHLEAYPDIDEDVKQALIDRGLLPGSDGKVVETEATVSSRSEIVGSNPTSPTSPIDLDDIIRNMQENSK